MHIERHISFFAHTLLLGVVGGEAKLFLHHWTVVGASFFGLTHKGGDADAGQRCEENGEAKVACLGSALVACHTHTHTHTRVYMYLT